jgi:hypothetical protein
MQQQQNFVVDQLLKAYLLFRAHFFDEAELLCWQATLVDRAHAYESKAE